MFKKIKKINPSLIFLIPVLLVLFIVIFTNFQAGTRLLSWDLMDSTWNPGLAISRSLFSVWQSFQGVGVLGGHGYQAQLPHSLIIGLFSFSIPQIYLRYLFAWICMTLGGVGMFFFTNSLQKKSKKYNYFTATIVSVLYILHYSTVQTFYVHLEPFIVMYASLPWTFLLLKNLLLKQTKRNWILILFLFYFTSIIGFIPPIFVFYSICICMYLITELLLKRNLNTFKTVMRILFLFVAVNAYWLLPFAYYTVTNPSTYLESKLNRFSTPEFVIKNKEFGSLENVALAKSFYEISYDQNRFSSQPEMDSILVPWITHFSQKTNRVLGITYFGLFILGTILLLRSGVKEKNSLKITLPIIGFLVVCLLGTDIPFLNTVTKILQRIPILSQAYRIPFSKLSMFYSFVICVGVSEFLIQCKLLFKKFSFIIYVVLFISILFYSSPSFTGNYFYKGARVTVPQPYTELINYLNNQDQNSRIAVLPIATFSGWDMHKWNNKPGYTGSGFLWYGIKQPILHRSFDVWSNKNQTFYFQLSKALYTNNSAQVISTLKQYNVVYVLLDKSIFVPGKSRDDLLLSQSKKMLEMNQSKVVFENDFLTLYKIPTDNSSIHTDLISSSKFVPISGDFENIQITPKSLLHTNFFTSNTYQNTIYPFLQTTNERPSVSISNSQITVHTDQNIPSGKYTVTTPGLESNVDKTLYVSFSYSNNTISIDSPISQKIIVEDTSIDLPTIPKIEITTDKKFDQATVVLGDTTIELENDGSKTEAAVTLSTFKPFIIKTFETKKPNAIKSTTIPAEFWNDVGSKGSHSITVDEASEISLQITSFAINLLNQNPNSYPCGVNTNCSYSDLHFLSNTNNYLLHFEGANIVGRSTKFYLQNLQTNRADVEDLLPKNIYNTTYSILGSATNTDGSGKNGYALHFENKSFGSTQQQNIFSKIEVYPLALQPIYEISLIPNKTPTSLEPTPVIFSRKLGSYFHIFEIEETNSDTILALNDATNSGWLGILVSKPANSLSILSNKTEINGWAAGWIVPTTKPAYIIVLYFPQLLSFIGFAFLITLPAIFLWHSK